MADHENTLLLDCDGTCTQGRGANPDDFAPIQPGLRQFLGALKDRGYEVVIFSARRNPDQVRHFFKQQGLDRFVDGYTRTKKPAKIIVDDRAIQFRGNYGDTLAEIDKFKPHWETEHKFSSVMAILPPDLAGKIKAIGEKVPDSDLHEDGREKEPHITIKWGIHGDDPAGVIRALADKKPARIKLGPLSLFESDEHDVLKMDVDSPELHEWNAAVNRECPHTDTHPEYHPHATVAYVKPGSGKKYLTLDGLDGESATLSEVVFSDRNNSRQKIPLLRS